MQLLRRCVSMILSGQKPHNFLELGCPILTSYLDNIERIGGREEAAPYWAYLEDLEEQVQMLNTFCQADVAMIAEIKGAQLRVVLMTHQEELRHQEEVWSRELVDLRASQGAIMVDMEKTDFEIEASQTELSGLQNHWQGSNYFRGKLGQIRRVF